MEAFEKLRNNYQRLVNNIKNSKKNNLENEKHNISEQDFIEACVDYANCFGEEIVSDLNSTINADNQSFEKYEDWIMNGD